LEDAALLIEDNDAIGEGIEEILPLLIFCLVSYDFFLKGLSN